MSRLTFTLRSAPAQRVDLSPLNPATLKDLSAAEIAALPIHTTRAALSVGELFDVADGDRDEIVIQGGSERFDRVGAGLSAGSIRVVGEVGVEAGRGMSGGHVVIEGSAGAYAGSGLRGGPGRTSIAGRVGETAAAQGQDTQPNRLQRPLKNASLASPRQPLASQRVCPTRRRRHAPPTPRQRGIPRCPDRRASGVRARGVWRVACGGPRRR